MIVGAMPIMSLFAKMLKMDYAMITNKQTPFDFV